MGLKEQLENHLIIILAGVIVVAGSIAWTASEKIRVEPRDREIAILKQQVADVKQNNCELKAAYDSYRAQIQQLLAKNRQLEKNLAESNGNLKQWYDALEGWKTQHSELQKHQTLI